MLEDFHHFEQHGKYWSPPRWNRLSRPTTNPANSRLEVLSSSNSSCFWEQLGWSSWKVQHGKRPKVPWQTSCVKRLDHIRAKVNFLMTSDDIWWLITLCTPVLLLKIPSNDYGAYSVMCQNGSWRTVSMGWSQKSETFPHALGSHFPCLSETNILKYNVSIQN